MTTVAEKVSNAEIDKHESWSRMRLGDICKIVRGVSYKKEQASEQTAEGRGPILRATNIQNGALVLDSDLVYVPADVVSEEQMLRLGDIVVATSSGSKHLVGKTAQIKELWAGSFGAFCAVLRPKVEIDHRYLGYFFGSKEYKNYITKKALGVNINNLRRGDLEEISIPIAPLDQQKRIVAEIEKQFSRLDEAVANLKRVKANLKRYKAAVLKAAVEGRLVETEAELTCRAGVEAASRRLDQRQDAASTVNYETGEQLLQRILETRRSQWQSKGKYKEPAAPDTTDLPELPEGWVWAAVGQTCFLDSGEAFKKRDYSTDGLRLLQIANVGFGQIEWEQQNYLPAVFDSKYPELTMRPGDIVLALNRPIIGERLKVACVSENDLPAILYQRVGRLRPVTGINSSYLFSFFQSPIMLAAVRKRLQGTDQPYLNTSLVPEITIPLPPVPEQHRIVAEVDRRLSLLREIEAQVDANLKRAVRLRQAVLSQAFSGGLA